MIKNRSLSFLLSFMLLCSCMNIATATQQDENRNFAEAVLGKSLLQTGMKLVEMGENKTANVAMKGGSYCWLMDKLQGNDKAYINFLLSEDMKQNIHDGSEYEFEIEYFDSGKGFVRLFYDSMNRSEETAYTIYTNNEKVWKTAVVKVSDALFSGKLNGKYDFRLSIGEQGTPAKFSKTSGESIAIRRVAVKRNKGKNPIYVTSNMEENGNTFKWYSEKKIIHNKFENLTDKPKTVKVQYYLVNDEHIRPFEKTETITFEANETKTLDLDIGEVIRADIYWYNISIKSDDGTIDSKFKPFEVAILKTDPEGILNKDILFATHFDRYKPKQIKMGVEMLKMSNSYGTRSDFGWADMEKAKGKLNWNLHSMKPIVDALLENGLYFMPILNRSSGFYCDGSNDMPRTPIQLEGWRNFVRYSATVLKDCVDCYEIWNEPNILSFNKYLDQCRGDVYMDMFKVAYEEIKKIDPTAKLGGPSLTGISIDVGMGYFNEAMQKDLWKYSEALALHPYAGVAAETADMDKSIQWYKDEYAKKGVVDPDIWNTETGYTTADKTIKNERTKGALNCRAAILYKAKDLSEKTVFYNFEKKGTIEVDREDQFGHVSSGYEESPKYGKWFVPTISYAMVTGHNYIMAESEAAGTYDSKDGNIRISKFKSNKFNSDIVTLYSVKEKKNVTLDLGTDKVTYYDSLGNSKELYGLDGVFTFMTDDAPAYIVGDIKKVEIESDTKFLKYNASDVRVSKNDYVNIEMQKYTSNNYTVELELPDCVEIIKNEGFNEDRAIITLKNLADYGEHCFVTVNMKDGEKIVQSSGIRITSAVSIIPVLSVSLTDTKNINNWKASMNITNMSQSKAAKGYVQFTSPESFLQLGKIDIGIIPRGRTGNFIFNLPKIIRKGQYPIEYQVCLDGGEALKYTDNIDFTIATYAYKKPTIDGNIEKNEWDMNTAMYADSASQIKQITEWGGINDLSGKSSIMWDEERIYMFAEVTDDVFYQVEPGATSWKGDGMQFGIVYGNEGFLAIGQASTTFHEICLSLSPEGATAYRTLSQDNFYPAGYCEDAQIVVKRTGNKTCYEFSMPWSSLLKPQEKPKEGDMLGYSFLINDNDGGGRRGWIEYASGIGETKNTELFTYLTLIK